MKSDLVQTAIAAAEGRLNGSGRVLVRPSGTEPLIRVMAEGDDERLISRVVKGHRRRAQTGGGRLRLVRRWSSRGLEPAIGPRAIGAPSRGGL